MRTGRLTVKSKMVDVRVGNSIRRIPVEGLRVLEKVCEAMSRGGGFRLFALTDDEEVTTEKAAGILNVSRPFVVELTRTGKLPARMVGTHRRIRLDDVLAYKARMRRAQHKALRDLADLDAELGLDR